MQAKPQPILKTYQLLLIHCYDEVKAELLRACGFQEDKGGGKTRRAGPGVGTEAGMVLAMHRNFTN